MTYNLNTGILDYDGTPILRDDKPLTWKNVIREALNNFARDESPSVEDKEKCFALTLRIFASPEVEFDAEEVAFILGRIRKIYITPLTIGRAKAFFDPPKTGE